MKNSVYMLALLASAAPIAPALAQLAILTFALMLWYSALLAGIAVAAFSLYALVRFVSFTLEREAREALIVSSGKEQSTLIETVRGIVTLRLFGREADRHVLWQNRLADATNAGLGAARIAIWQSTANTLIFGIENILTVWLGIRLVIGGGFSIGMIFAYLAYKQLFIGRASTLIDPRYCLSGAWTALGAAERYRLTR